MSGFASFAPAKLNLSLHVGPPGADGFHPLASLAAFARDVGDTVRAAPGDGVMLTVTGPFAAGLAAEPDNLVTRAAQLLAQAAGVQANVALHLDKHLPIASGIGGGSSDAAAALRACAALWRVGASSADLAAIAAQLGSDVPACLAAQTALMTGRGDALAPARMPALHAVLVNPLAPAPTGAVYRAYDASCQFGGAEHPPLPDASTGAADWLAFLIAQRNDLTAAAITVAPAIAPALAALREAAPDALVRLSGSGATVFAAVAVAARAQATAAMMRARHPGWWIAVSELGSVDVAARPV